MMNLDWMKQDGVFDVKKIKVFIASFMGLSIIFLHSTILPPAIPLIQSQLMTSNLMTRWILNIYFLTAACSVIVCGKLADSFGHKRNLLWGFILSGVSSLIAGFAHHALLLLICRGVQGVAVGLLSPSFTSIIFNAFPKQDHGKSLGFVTGASSIFMILGPFLGGSLTHFYSWRWTFYLFAPLALIGIASTKYIADFPKEKRSGYLISCKEFFVFSLPIASLVFGFMNVKGWGWTSLPFFLCVAFSVLWVIFIGKFFKLEQEPFSYRNILSISSFRLGLFILCVAQFVMMNSIFWGTFFQKGLGYSPFKIGLIALTFSLPTIFVSPYSGHVSDSKGFFFPIALGHSLIVIGISLMNLLVVKQLYHFLLIPMSITGSGVGLLLTSTGTLAMQEILPEQRGLFAGVYNTVRFGGAALAIAFLGSVGSYFRYERMTKIVQQLHELYDFSVREIIDVLSGRFPLSFLGPHVSDETLSLVKQGFFSVSQEGFQFLNIIVLVLVFFSFFYSLSFFKKIKYQNLLSQKNKNS